MSSCETSSTVRKQSEFSVRNFTLSPLRGSVCVCVCVQEAALLLRYKVETRFATRILITCSGSSPSTGTPLTSTSLSPAYSSPAAKTRLKVAAGGLRQQDYLGEVRQGHARTAGLGGSSHTPGLRENVWISVLSAWEGSQQAAVFLFPPTSPYNTFTIYWWFALKAAETFQYSSIPRSNFWTYSSKTHYINRPCDSGSNMPGAAGGLGAPLSFRVFTTLFTSTFSFSSIRTLTKLEP